MSTRQSQEAERKFELISQLFRKDLTRDDNFNFNPKQSKQIDIISELDHRLNLNGLKQLLDANKVFEMIEMAKSFDIRKKITSSDIQDYASNEDD